jgi:3-oxoacyl-[acyl-carrier protein] reductase
MSFFFNQTAVITGASRGIGYEIARQFARHGAKVAVLATKQEVIDGVAQKIAAEFGVEAKGYACNVADFSEVEAVFKQILVDFGTIEILVNNAGITKDTLMLRMKEADWDSVIDTNLKSVFNTTKAVSRQMLKQKYGRIINMSSINALVAQPGQANYAASKAGVIGFTQSVAKELASVGVTVNAIAPGFIQTDMTSEMNEEYKEKIAKSIPVGYLGETQDIAHTTVFLAMKESRYITGQVISVDGGLNA